MRGAGCQGAASALVLAGALRGHFPRGSRSTSAGWRLGRFVEDGGRAPAHLPGRQGALRGCPGEPPARPLLTRSPTRGLSIIFVTAFRMSLFLPQKHKLRRTAMACAGPPGPDEEVTGCATQSLAGAPSLALGAGRWAWSRGHTPADSQTTQCSVSAERLKEFANGGGTAGSPNSLTREGESDGGFCWG